MGDAALSPLGEEKGSWIQAQNLALHYATNANLPRERWNVYHDLYEAKGCYWKEDVMKGRNKEILESTYNLTSHGCEDGWYTLDHIETYAECNERGRKWAEKIRVMLSTPGKTVIMVLHGTLLDSIVKN